jgi:hypothetical protein
LISERAVEAIESSNTDELIRVVDGLCETGDWDGLAELKQRCAEAVTRGKQVWGVEEHIRYRLALEAPAPWAGAAVSEGVARFALGPLPEVAASTKSWAELDPHLSDGPWRRVTAAERVVRGDEDVTEIDDLPATLMPWENYSLPTYKSDKVETPSPATPAVEVVELPDSFEKIMDPQSEGALYDLVDPWVTQSNGRADIATVEGTALAAIRALGLARARVGELTAGEAIAWIGWVAASGGAHGHRRGAAAGRFGVWWLIATLSDLPWPPDPDQIGAAAEGLRYVWFDDGSPGTGWQLRLAVEEPGAGIAWAISAVDTAD